MTVWRYIAVPTTGRGQEAGRRQRGELAGESAAAVRAALRRVGMQVIDVRPVRASSQIAARSAGSAWWSGMRHACAEWWHRHLRARRRSELAELYDAIATMLDAGEPTLQAFAIVRGSMSGRQRGRRSMLVQLHEDVRSGRGLADAMASHPGWFDSTALAMVQSGEQSGTLASVLRTLAERQHRAGELTGRLINALVYPIFVAVVGLGVVIFLSVHTLPQLTALLEGANITVPGVTLGVMGFGQFIATEWPLLLTGLLAFSVMAAIAWRVLAATDAGRRTLDRLQPLVLRRVAVSGLALQLADLLRTAVPLVESLRIVAPALRNPVLRSHVRHIAGRIEEGEDLATVFDAPRWFDAEFRRLIEIGQASGELPALLERIGDRYARQSSRLIDRLTTLLEPTVIIVLAVLVGIVVMASILPLMRLQEILG